MDHTEWLRTGIKAAIHCAAAGYPPHQPCSRVSSQQDLTRLTQTALRCKYWLFFIILLLINDFCIAYRYNTFPKIKLQHFNLRKINYSKKIRIYKRLSDQKNKKIRLSKIVYIDWVEVSDLLRMFGIYQGQNRPKGLHRVSDRTQFINIEQPTLNFSCVININIQKCQTISRFISSRSFYRNVGIKQ